MKYQKLFDAHQREFLCQRWKVWPVHRSRWNNHWLSDQQHRLNGMSKIDSITWINAALFKLIRWLVKRIYCTLLDILCLHFINDTKINNWAGTVLPVEVILTNLCCRNAQSYNWTFSDFYLDTNVLVHVLWRSVTLTIRLGAVVVPLVPRRMFSVHHLQRLEVPGQRGGGRDRIWGWLEED